MATCPCARLFPNGVCTFYGVTLALLMVLAALLVAPGAALGGGQDVVRGSQARGSKGPILYVGDSLGVGTFPQLRSMLAGVSLDGDTVIGRTSTQGLSVLRSKLRRRHRVVIFDLGSNDSSAATLAKNLKRAHRRIGDRLMLVLTMNKPGVGPFNRAVRAFASSAGNVALVDWRSTAGKENLLAGDGVHAAAWGYRRRAALIANQIGGRHRTTN